MKKKNIFLFKPSFLNILLLLLGIGLNILGTYITELTSAPVWLDSLGTAFCSCLLGPLAGSFVGILSYIFCHITAPAIWLYALISIPMSFCISISYQQTKFRDLFQLLCTAMLTAVISIAGSVPLNLFLRDGQIDNIWGDALFDMLTQTGNSSLFGSFCGQAFVDIPDKVLCLLITFCLLNLPKVLHKIKKGGEAK